VKWSDPGDHLTLGVYGHNLGNTTYVTSLIEGAQGEVISRGLPRMYGVSIGYKF
jgi:outer membrane receptor protein involved in Fe transport